MCNIIAVLNSHIQQLIRGCISLNAELIAIILYGGYGRNEGSWIITENGDCRPYNDYDILLVVKNKIPKHSIEALRKDLAKQIGIQWIDIGQIKISRLRRLRPTIYNYDLKYGSKVIKGDKNVLSLIPEMDATKLPLKEGETLFFTRIWTLLGSLHENGFEIILKGEESRFFRNQMAKAILSIVDVLLLQKGSYHLSYNERVKNLSKLYPQKTRLLELSKWALEEKLFPKNPNMTSEDVNKLYQELNFYFFREMYHLLTKYYGRKINSPEKIAIQLKWAPSNFIKRLSWILLRRNLNWERKIIVNLAQTYVATAYNDKANYEDYLQQAIKYIRILDKSFSENSSWNEARVRIAQLRLEI